MALTGFNPQLVKKSIKAEIDAYNDLYDALITVTQNSVVTPMGNLWCCKEAVEFFNKIFKPVVDDLQTGMTNTFQSIVDSMNSAATNWAKRTGNTDAWSNVSFSPRTAKIDVSMIKAQNAKGEIGIDEIEAVAKSALLLTKTHVKATAALTKATVGVGLCGFLGGQQASDLKHALSEIKKALENATKEMAEGIKKSIQDSAEGYKSVGVAISNAFKGQ